jgi:hypothetical protein
MHLEEEIQYLSAVNQSINQPININSDQTN